MIRIVLAALLLYLVPLSGFTLKESLSTAKKGDFIVYGYKESVIFIRIKENSDEKLILEEISLQQAKKPTDWKKFREENAPFHTSWTESILNKKDFSTEAVISIDSKEVIDPEFSLLPTLLSSELTKIPESDRKKIGPEPLQGEVDHRKIWNPKIIYNGMPVDTAVSAYILIWPKDTSDLSGHRVELYVPDQNALLFFPYFIEILTGPLKVKIFAIDSGNI